MTRQMLSAVSSGRMPLWRSTSRRIMSASRAGRNAEPLSCVCLTEISRSMISPRSISSRVHGLVDAVDLAAQIRERWCSGIGRFGHGMLVWSVRSARDIDRGRVGPKAKKTLTEFGRPLSKPDCHPRCRGLVRGLSECGVQDTNISPMANRPPSKAMADKVSEMVEAVLAPVDRVREADEPHSHVVRFGPDKPLRLDAGVDLVAVPDRLPDLRHAQRRAHQRGADLPRADRRPACRQCPSRHRQGRLVGHHGRARPADRHRALFRDLPERHRRLHGHARVRRRPIPRPASPGASNSPSSPSATWCARRRCCSTISASNRCSRWPAARWAACRCCNGRRAIPSACSRRCRSRPRRATRRRTSRSTRSAARRSWPIRSGARGAISPKARIRAKASRSRAWARTSPICRTRRCTASSAAASRTATIRRSRSTPISRWRAICATRASRSSSASTPIPISTSRARWTISTSPPTTAACSPMPSSSTPTRFCVISFTSDWLFPTSEFARHRACAQCRRRAGLVRRDRHRQGPRRLPARRAGAVRDRARLPRRRRQGARASARSDDRCCSRLKRDLTMAEAARTPGGARVDLLVVADMVERGAKVLDVGCGDGELLRLLGGDAQRRRPRHRAVARGRERRRGQGPRRDPGRRRHRPVGLSERRLRLRDPVADAAGDAAAARRARAHAAHRPARRSCRSRISATGGSACRSCSAGTCRGPTTCPMRGGNRPTSTSAPSRTSASCAKWSAPRWRRSVALNAWGSPIRLKVAVVVLEPVRRAGGVPAEPQEELGRHVTGRAASSYPRQPRIKGPQDSLRRLGSIRLTPPSDGGYRGDGDRPARLDS